MAIEEILARFKLIFEDLDFDKLCSSLHAGHMDFKQWHTVGLELRRSGSQALHSRTA